MQQKSNIYSKASCLAAIFLLLHAGSLYAAYCTPYNGSTFASSGGVNVITALEVPFTGLVHYSTTTNGIGYSQISFSGGNPVFRQSSTYVIKATVSNAAEVKAWIDHNQDNTYQSSEEISFTISGNTATGIVTIPATATMGTTQLRVMAAASSYSIPGPCGNMVSGEAEDYTIDISGPTSCAVPAGLASVATKGTTNKLKWTGAGGATFQFTYATSANFPTKSIANQSDDSVDLTGLKPGTRYYFFVRSVCGPNDFSDWAIDSFTTFVCHPPKLKITQGSVGNAVAAWDSIPGAIDYQYALSLSSNVPTRGTIITSPALQLIGLHPNTRYCFFVRTYCSNGELSDWVSDCFTTWRLSVGDINGNITACYPNPVKDKLNVSLRNDAELILSDISGRALLRMHSADKKAMIDISSLADGIYFLKCMDGEQPATVRIVKQSE